MIQAAFAQPEVSRRRNRSAKTVIISQNQMIQAKTMSRYQKPLRNG